MKHAVLAVTESVYDRLRVVQTDGEAATVIYLGYPLRLSPGETRLLLCLLRETLLIRRVSPELDTVEVATTTLQAAVDCSPEQIKVQVSRINRKAEAIGGRRLILGRSHRGYAFHPYM